MITTVHYEDNNSNKLVPGSFDTVYYEDESFKYTRLLIHFTEEITTLLIQST